ncbi:MAG TPA: ASPIC/UnbV domain-containing protein, partial [Pyrinomonadaceae bacterium]|nr:ASPIC/UnbV domain-containing protein [Pyrinomonadaceae bacterium]
WLNLQLTGDVEKKTPRDAIGTVAYLSAGKMRQRLDVISGAVYCSQNDLTLHFGLGSASRVDKLEIQWANGSVETFDVPSIDQTVSLIQGKGVRKN